MYIANSAESVCFVCKARDCASLFGYCKFCGSNLILDREGRPFVPVVKHDMFKATIYGPEVRDRRTGNNWSYPYFKERRKNSEIKIVR